MSNGMKVVLCMLAACWLIACGDDDSPSGDGTDTDTDADSDTDTDTDTDTDSDTDADTDSDTDTDTDTDSDTDTDTDVVPDGGVGDPCETGSGWGGECFTEGTTCEGGQSSMGNDSCAEGFVCCIGTDECESDTWDGECVDAEEDCATDGGVNDVLQRGCPDSEWCCFPATGF